MNNPEKLDEKMRALRKELSRRTVNLHLSDAQERAMADDAADIIDIGKKISKSIDDERLEEAREQLRIALAEYPEELMFLNLQMILDGLDKPFGNYNSAKKAGSNLIEVAVEKYNTYYTMAAIVNLGLIAHNEGHDDFSKAMYLAAHFIDRKAITPMRNLAGWYSRRGFVDKAQMWVRRIIEAYPDWLDREELITVFLKDESLANLRKHEPFKQEVLAKIERK
jgi:tetratricopeptide (TPR) repeat protein